VIPVDVKRRLVGCSAWVLSAALTAAAAAGAAEHDLEVVRSSLPATIDTAAELEVELEIANRGSGPWSAELGDALAYHWLDADGTVAVWDGDRSGLGERLEPGQRRALAARLRAPSRAGDYCLQWDLVREGVRWISEVDPTPVQCQPVEVIATHAFSLLSVDAPRVLFAGGRRPAAVKLRNDGSRTWPAGSTIALAWHWLDGAGAIVEWEGDRTTVDRVVPPGAAVELRTLVSAPERAGRLRLAWDMVDDGVCWFSDRDPSPAEGLVVLVVGPRVAAVLWTALVATAAVAVAVRGRRRGRIRGAWAVLDLGWLVGAVMIRQAWVLHEAGHGLSSSGWCLAGASAAAGAAVLLALPGRLRPWVSFLASAAMTALLFVDLVHLRFFSDLASMAALRSAGQLGDVGSSVRSLLGGGDLWFWADLAPGLLLAWGVARFGREGVRRRHVALGGAAVALVLALCGLVTVDHRLSLRQLFHATEAARQVGVLNLHAADAGGTVLRRLVRPRLDEAELAEVVAYFDRRRPLRAGAGPLFGAAGGANLLMIQVESLQAFVVGLEVGGREVTPTLNDLVAAGFWFANLTDQTEEGRSSDAELATQTSLLPPDRGAAAFLHAGNRFTGIAGVLGETGYTTLSAVPFDGGFWNRRTTHRAYGYQRSLFVEDFAPGETVGWGLDDRSFLVQAVGRLAELPEPWCGLLLTLSLHHPFDGFPDHLKVIDVGRAEGTPYGNFLHTMHHFDRGLADLLAALAERGLADRTVVALWGDHDAGFEWGPEIARAVGQPANAVGWYLSQQVPFAVLVPGVNGPGAPLAVPAGHTDVAPTLLALLGVDPEPLPLIGRNLLGEPGAGPVVGEYRCWSDATRLFLRRGPELGDGECIELATLSPVASSACADSFEAARRQVEISRLVLEHDLQERIRAALDHQP
jgi:phosphoglycerol transferase MdoB-like AlkP superfamily enzyme